MSAPCRRTILRPARKKDTGWDTGHNQSQLRTAHEPAEEHLHVAALADRSVFRSVGRSARRWKEGRASEGAPIGNCGSRGRQPDYYVHEMVRCSESSLGASAAESGSWRDCCCCQFSDASVGDDTVSIEISAGLPSPAYVWFGKREGYKTHCFYGVKTSWWLARTALPSARVWTSVSTLPCLPRINIHNRIFSWHDQTPAWLLFFRNYSFKNLQTEVSEFRTAENRVTAVEIRYHALFVRRNFEFSTNNTLLCCFLVWRKFKFSTLAFVC